MNQKININNLTPVIATISAGKTSFLNAVYNIKFLEVSRQIGTKFVNIIRYNPKLGKTPKFYHLIVKKNSRTKDYDFYKDTNSEVIGDEKIAKKNAEINAELKKRNFLFEDIFYMTEVGEVSLIKDEEYLNNYDLVDIPGLSEYLPSEEDNAIQKNNLREAPNALIGVQNLLDLKKRQSRQKLEQSKMDQPKEVNYLTGIFTIIKNKVNNGIIIFDAENLGREENFDIIKRFHDIIKRPIIKFLILLNKVDERKNIKADIKALETSIERFDPTGSFFYYTKNTLLPCSTFSLKNEVNIEKNFKYLMCYYFFYYKLKNKKENETFLDYLINILILLNDENNRYNKSEVLEDIEKFLNFKNLDDNIEEIKQSIIKIKSICQNYNSLKIGLINEDKFNKNNIKEILEKIKEDESDSDSDDNSQKKNKKDDYLIIRNLPPEFIIIRFYLFYKDKKNMPPLSMGNKKIIEYFTMENMNKIIDIGGVHYQNNITIKNLEETLKNLKSFYEDYKKKYVLVGESKQNYRGFRNQIVEKDINVISQKLEKFKYFYLPLVGMNNSGKSTILNDLIGYDLLPTGKDINTKKGILIKYCDGEPEINKVKFNYNSGKCLFTHEAFLGKGVQDVKKILRNINANFADKEENFFYEVFTKIKFFEENKFAQQLKDKICFIDLPGYATKYQFEKRDIHSQLIKCCELVIFVFEIIKKGNNREYLYSIIDDLKTNFRNEGSRTDAALQHRILFINNIFENNYYGNKFTKTKNDFEKEIKVLKQKAKEEIIEIFGKTFNEPNICVLNAQNYFDYAYNLNKFEQIYDFLEYELIKFERQKEDFYKGETNEKGVQKDFLKYLKIILNDEYEKAKNSSTLSEEKIEKENISPKEMEQIEGIAKKYFGKDNKSKKFDKIVSLFSEIKKIANLYKFSIDLSNSYYERFSKDLKCFILFGEKIKNKNLIDNLNSVLSRLNIIFFQPFKGKEPKVLTPEETESSFEKESDKLQEIFSALINNMKNDLLNKEENNIPKDLKKILDNLQQSLIEQKEKINKIGIKEESNEGSSFFGYLYGYVNQFGKNMVNRIDADINFLYSSDWKITQDKLKIIFQKEANNFKDSFKNGVYNYSKIVDDYYEKVKNIYNHYLVIYKNIFGEKCKEELENISKYINYKTFKDYIEISFDVFNNKKLEDILEDIKNEIIEGAEESTYYENSPSLLNFLKKKLSNTEYLYSIIDYINENASKKFNQFIKDFEEIFFKYLENFIDNLKIMRQLIVIILDNIIELEKKFIDEKKLENEEELKKYNKEKEEWEKTCNDYEEIKNNFEIYINEIKDYLSENIDPGISGMTANKELNNIKQEYNPLNEKVIITSEKNIINRPKYEQPINNPSLISNDLTASTHTRAFNGKNIIQQGNENKNNLRIAKESYQNQNINNYSKNNNIIVTTQTANNQQKDVMNNNQNNSRIDYHAQKAYVQPKNDEELKTKKDTPPKNVSESEYNYQAGNQDTGKTGIRKRYVRYGYRRIGKDPDNNA